MTDGPLSSTAQALLDCAIAALEADTAGRAPTRSFVSHNAPAWEACTSDQLTVHLFPLGFRQSANRGRIQSQALPQYHVQIVRCVPGQGNQGQAPTAAALSESAKGLMDDLDLIQAAVRSVAASIFGACDHLVYGQATPLGPAGIVGGYDWAITTGIG